MQAQLARVHWGLILKTGVLLYILISLLGLGLSLLWLAFINWSHVDLPSAYQPFSWVAALLVLVVTGYGASRVARKVANAAPLHGFLIGLVVALISLLVDLVLGGGIDWFGLGISVAAVAAGWLGGILGSRGQVQP